MRSSRIPPGHASETAPIHATMKIKLRKAASAVSSVSPAMMLRTIFLSYVFASFLFVPYMFSLSTPRFQHG
jgi:hypothetical protein